MLFGQIHFAYLFLLVVLLMLFLLFTRRGREKALVSFAQKELLTYLTSTLDRRKTGIKMSLILIALIFCIVALMRPQAGFRWEEGKRIGVDILVAIDTSKSMLAEDIKPSRLNRAKEMTKDFLKTLKGDRVGLIAFSGTAFLVCPLTADYNAFLLSLESIDDQTIPKGGTSISSAMREALKDYRGGTTQHKALVILTDGEDHEGDLMGAIELAKKDGLKIFCAGFGTREGELIPAVDQAGERDFLKDRGGQVVKTSINETLLQKIAFSTGGTYLRADERRNGLRWIYEEKLSRMEKGEFEAKMKKQHREWYQIPLFIGLVLIVLEPLIGGKRKEVNGKKGVWKSVFSVLLLVLASCNTQELSDANRFYHQGNYGDALRIYQKAVMQSKDSPILNYNVGTVLYKKGDYLLAVEYFTKGLNTKDQDLESKANYNIGNCKFRLGEQVETTDLQKAADYYREALDYYERASELNSQDEDAIYNHRWVEKKLRDLLARLGQTGTLETSLPPSEPSAGKELDRISPPGGQGQPEKKIDKSDQTVPSGKREDITGEMSKEKAGLTLEDYRLEEEAGMKAKESRRKGYEVEVQKDW